MRPSLLLLLATLWASSASAVTLSGRVTDTAGSGVHPIRIDVYISSNGTLVNTPDDTTNAQGFYSMQLQAGTYNLVFNPAAGSHLFKKTVNFVNVSTNTTLNVTLPRGHYLSGRVVNASGVGVFNVDLDFLDPTTGDPAVNVQGDHTDVNGYYTAIVDSAVWNVPFMPPAASKLVPQELVSVDLRSDQNAGTLVVPPGFYVHGTVTDAGFFPIADADLDARVAGTRPKLYTPGDNTDAGGSYTLLLPAGTYDISAAPPPGEPYADATARSIAVSADVTAPNLVLPPGFQLRARCKDPGGIAVAQVDMQVDSLPRKVRLETENHFSDAGGNIQTLVSAWKFRVRLLPPVSTKLLPVQYDSLQISAARDLGDVTFARGHWVSGHVVESGTGVPIAGANLDFFHRSTGTLAITEGDLTDASGFFQVVTDGDLYRLRVAPPSTSYDTLFVDPFGSLNDTTVTLTMHRHSTPVLDPVPSSRLRLAAPWPNPAHGEVVLGFSAPPGKAELTIVDLAGRRVATLFDGAAAGPHEARWNGRAVDGRPLPSGVYLVRLAAGGEVKTRRLVLLE